VGAGKVGWETEHLDELAPSFQIAQRSEFFEELVGLETTIKRPIVNTRDEPHADSERFRRLHVIIGDANLSQTATFVKVGSTALLLAALEEWGVDRFPALPRTPVRAVREFSCDLDFRVAVSADDGVTRTAWDYQDHLWQLAHDFFESTGAASVADAPQISFLLEQWREMLDGVRYDRDRVADRVDWVAKHRLVSAYAERHHLEPLDSRLRAIDLQYHDLRPERSLAQRCGLRELIATEAWRAAVSDPPEDTRAYFRGMCLSRYPDEVIAANWDSLLVDLGEAVLRRIPMMDPLRGTRQLTASLFDSCATAAELIVALDA
jgi:proteasome accessory factor A